MQLTAIIPTLGVRPRMLVRAVSSIRAQRHAVDELLIVVDAGEATAAALDARFDDTSVLYTAGPCGVSAARNLGARQARGHLLAFLDDDDVWKERYLERVFAPEEPFDVALTAFEKHRPGVITPEKIPPRELHAEHFLVKNPGLRGSNLIIRRDVYLDLGGFDERLPAFNDMDLGIRLCDAGPWRYRRLTDHLVEFHSHRGARLSTPGSRANRAGMTRYWERYQGRMTPSQRDTFCSRAVRIWGVDPRTLTASLRDDEGWG